MAARRIGRAALQCRVLLADHAGGLQFKLELVGPEPGHFRLGCRCAADRRGRVLGLVERIGHGFQPYPRAGQPVLLFGTIADREDGRIRSAAFAVDTDAVSCG